MYDRIIKYRDQIREVPPGYIVDVQQSSRYIELEQTLIRSRSPIPLLSLGFNVDGVRSFDSAKISVVPDLLCIYELPLT